MTRPLHPRLSVWSGSYADLFAYSCLPVAVFASSLPAIVSPIPVHMLLTLFARRQITWTPDCRFFPRNASKIAQLSLSNCESREGCSLMKTN